MKKTVSQTRSARYRFLAPSKSTTLLVLSGFILMTGSLAPVWQRHAYADQYQDQINALQAQNNSTQAAVNDLQAQAASYADAIAKLQVQIDGLQASINANLALQTSLQQQIAAAQAEIVRQRDILASDIKAMYVDGTPSSLEVLAGSSDLSDFVDKQEYRTRVQSKLQNTLKKIAELEKQLQVQKAKVEQLIRDMQVQQSQLNADRAKQWEMLNYNEEQQGAFNAQIAANNSKVAELKAAQAAANRRLTSSSSGVIAGDPSKGGYPAKWANAPQDSMLDDWGMYNRECVSYTAWKVFQTYGYMPYWGGVGNANQWPGNAARARIPTSNQPREKTVAVSMAGYYGHVMWVESVNADGSIWVSQYNYGVAGTYSEMRIDARVASTLIYIYFN